MAAFLLPTKQIVARAAPLGRPFRRAVSTLSNNEHIVRAHHPFLAAPLTRLQYVHDLPGAPNGQHLLSYLPNTPPIPSLAIGTTTRIPPTPDSLKENPEFMSLLHHIIGQHAHEDPDVQAQAALYASQAGSALGSGGVFFPQQQQQQRRSDRRSRQPGGGGGGASGDGAGGASSQGGMGGAGRGGHIHVSDQRNPPDFGRVAWPEDIFGSLEIDAQGRFVDGTGRYQAAGTYRVVTQDGVLGLSPYLRARVVEKVRELDEAARGTGRA